MSETPEPPPGADGRSWLQDSHGAIVLRCSLLAGLTRLVPVPFLDDILLDQVHAHLVRSLLKLRPQACAPELVKPLHSGPSRGCLAIALFILLLPLKLVFAVVKKFFKLIVFVLAIREAALIMSFAVLYGRAVDRRLQAGDFDAGAPPEELEARAARVWEAGEESTKNSDLRLIKTIFIGVLPRARSMLSPREALREELGSRAGSQTGKLEALRREAAAALASPEALAYLEDFDRRFDAAYARKG